MTFPTVTITVAGAGPVDPVEAEQGLHMMYVQAVKGDKRQQWVVFPPAVKELGVPEDKIQFGELTLHRTQEFAGNRTKWFHYRQSATTYFKTALAIIEADGWIVSDSYVVPLEKDDYLAAWNGSTPHKALRAVGRAIEPFGLSVK